MRDTEQRNRLCHTTRDEPRYIKCLVWDLDNTLWHGVLLEDKEVSLKDNVADTIQMLDRRGILQSIASMNDDIRAMKKLGELGLQEYFVYPQIHWRSKVESIQTIAQAINVDLDAIALIDDQPFERDQVRFSLPKVLCIDAADLDQLLHMPEMNPRFVTKDSRMRRPMLFDDMARKEAEEAFVGPKEAFLASLNMVLTIFQVGERDLKRAQELTVRTNQLNATGFTYSYHELDRFRQSGQHKLLMARLEDKYGSYGHIALALIECMDETWTVKLLLVSCRVMSRGVGSILLTHIIRLAKQEDVRLRAEFVPTGRNRMMDITYRLAGFSEVKQMGNVFILQNDFARIQTFPNYVKVRGATGA